MPSSYSLYELNEYIKRVIALNFTEPIWVNCEISQIKEVRGNVYLDLVHHNEDSQDITAQISASIWYKSYLFIKNKLGELLPSILKEGSHVLVKVNVEFNERYGLKLVIEDIDPSFTIGQMEMNRQKIIQKLSDDGLIDQNKKHKLPTVIKRVAIISSDTAAGYIDFYKHLKNNGYGYTFEIDLYKVALQGQNTSRDTVAAFQSIDNVGPDYDVVLIIRGGGSKLDLAAFDSYNIGAAIAKCRYPVITGIGHDIDSTVADLCAFQFCKTPTAVADMILEHNFGFETDVMDKVYWIGQTAKQKHRQTELLLFQAIQLIKVLPTEILQIKHFSINRVKELVNHMTSAKISLAHQKLVFAERQIQLLDPKKTLRRGYTIVYQEDQIVSKGENIKKGKSTSIQFYDKTINISDL